jgi:hypothetical protein
MNMYEERDEHEEARRLLAPLASEPTRPSMVDVSRAVADGRRRLRTRRIAGVGTVAAVTALVVAGVPAALAAVRAPDAPPVASGSPTATPSPSPNPSLTPYPVPTTEPEPAPEPPTSCELELPPVPPDANPSIAFGTDPTGRIVYGKYYQPVSEDETSIQQVLWIDGEAVPIDVPGVDPNIHAVNSSGWAVGTSLDDGEADRHVAWIYHDGQVTELAGDDVDARAITEDGVVLGTRAGGAVPVVWDSPEALPADLPVPASVGSYFMSELLPDGTAVGFRFDDTLVGHSYVWWPDGSVQEIPLPEFDGEQFGFRARFLNGHLVVGEATLFGATEDGGDRWYAAVYDLRTGEFTRLAEDAPVEMLALNRHGWIAGEVEDGQARLWTPEGGLLPLPDLGVDSEYPPTYVQWVTDDGRVVTGEVETGGTRRAAVWRCD